MKKTKANNPALAEEPARPGALANCDRCGVQLRVAATRREDSAPFRRAKVPKGLCPDCVMTEFLYNTYPINWQLDERGPELLLHPMIRGAFLSSGVMSHSEMSIDEVNWQRVVDNWKLPVRVAKGDGRNPYRMGEARERPGWGTFKGLRPGGSVFENAGTLVVRRDPASGELLANGRPLAELGQEPADSIEALLKALPDRHKKQ